MLFTFQNKSLDEQLTLYNIPSFFLGCEHNVNVALLYSEVWPEMVRSGLFHYKTIVLNLQGQRFP